LGFTTDSGHEAAARAVVETVVTVSTAPFGSVVVVVVVVVVVDIVPNPRTLDSALTVRASARCMQPRGWGDACAHLTIICPRDVPAVHQDHMAFCCRGGFFLSRGSGTRSVSLKTIVAARRRSHSRSPVSSTSVWVYPSRSGVGLTDCHHPMHVSINKAQRSSKATFERSNVRVAVLLAQQRHVLSSVCMLVGRGTPRLQLYQLAVEYVRFQCSRVGARTVGTRML
jgi:hypothetical protein